MANVKTTLTITGENTNSFSNSRGYTEEVVSKFYVDNTDTFTDLIQFSPDDESPTKTATTTAAPKAFCLYNSGSTGLEIQMQTTKWTHAAPDTVSDEEEYNSMLLGAGEMFFSNNLRIIQTSAENSAGEGGTSALALASDTVSTALTSSVARVGPIGAAIDGEDSSSATSIAVDDAAE